MRIPHPISMLRLHLQATADPPRPRIKHFKRIKHIRIVRHWSGEIVVPLLSEVSLHSPVVMDERCCFELWRGKVLTFLQYSTQAMVRMSGWMRGGNC